MIKWFVALMMCVLSVHAIAGTRVKPYYKKNGTYVDGYYKTSPNSSRWDNYSTKGNYNPYSGKVGKKSPYKW